ncbi:SH3 domain-containing protein [Fimbriiglobus ruber]|uniref:SH3b domain-containing protein n=1 Tax=Fimbriiglobus ruber TaxID=1908690 RepID=A0A225E6C3_9BACT|nr:SH3 domain-containing protein [Fimbriiglobus ruber]OWK45656.1 hypothetical protein FRUB_01987 [Fimbriiglobus ruber]
MSRRLLPLLVAGVLVSPAFAQPLTVPTAPKLRDPIASFNKGVENRLDAARARPEFADAAADIEDIWRKEERARTPEFALARGRAQFLAGDLPRAIRAFRDGLAIAPYDADLQHGLAACRAAVAYPAEADPAARVRPDPTTALCNRVTQTDLLVASVVASLLLAVGLARRFTTRDEWAVPVAAVGVVGLALVAAVAWQIERERQRDRERTVLVVKADAVLRTGNGLSFPPRIDAPLPRGAEVRALGHRGGWVQVELPGGAVGWVPEAAVLNVTE